MSTNMIDSELKNEDKVNTEVFEKFLHEIKSSMFKGKFRKVLDDLKSKSKIFKSLPDYWKLTELKIKAMSKIVKRKINKYELITSKHRSIENWLISIDNEIDDWFNSIFENFEQNLEKLEAFIQNLLENLHNHALMSQIEKKMGECAGFLALGEKIIKVFTEITHDPRTLNISTKILLFISSLHILDEDYDTAKIYQSQVLKLSFRELFFRVNLGDEISTKNMSKACQHYIEKIFVNVVIAFYHRGICEENLGKFIKSSEAYSQAKWFSLKFLKITIPELAQFISDVNLRSQDITKVFSKTGNGNLEILKKEKRLISKKKEKSRENLSSDFENLVQKHDKTIKYIQSLKFPEFENNSMNNDENLKEILYTINTAHNLMSSNFKHILKDIQKIDVHKLDKTTFNVIQKKLNELKAEENYKRNNSVHELVKYNSLQKPKKSIHLSPTQVKKNRHSMANIVFFESDFLIPTEEFSCKLDLQSQRTRNNIKFENKQINENFNKLSRNETNFEFNEKISNHIKSFSKSEMSHKKSKSMKSDIIEKYRFDDFISDKNYQKKLSKLDHLTTRELTFQKKLLNIKKIENGVIPELNTKDNENSLNFKLKMMMNKNKFRESKTEIKSLKDKYLVSKEKIDKSKLEMKLIKGLNTQTYNEYTQMQLVNLNKRPKLKLRPEFTGNKINSFEFNYEKLEENNNDLLKKINKELDMIDKVSAVIRDNDTNKISKKIPSSRNFQFFNKSNKSMEDFIKIKRRNSNR